MDYTVIGTDVNIAQRLASKAESGQTLITDRGKENLVCHFPAKVKRSILLKGLESEVTVYSMRVIDEIKGK